MAYVITNNQHYINIANAIRSNSFGDIEGPLPVSEFAQRIREISDIGKREGKAEGYAQGLEKGMPAGIQSEYDRFWDDFQQNGERTYYVQAFGGPWTDKTFRPKYDLTVTGNGFGMFRASLLTGSLKQILADAGVSLTFYRCPNIGSLFQEAYNITEIGELDFSSITRKDCAAVFSSCTKLKVIEKIVLPVGQTSFSNWFYNCSSLENVTFEGTINASGLNVSWSPLTHDSLMNIINCLADKSTDTNGTTWAVTLGTTNLAKLTDAEKAIATQKGWTLA